MSIEIRYQEKSGYLMVEAHGQWTEYAAREQIDAVRYIAYIRRFTRLLLDVRDLSSPASDVTRFFTGEHIAEVLPPPFRVAALARYEFNNSFSETVAVNQGAYLTVFADEKAALQWLLAGYSKQHMGYT